MAEPEIILKADPTKTVKEAAEEAANQYPSDRQKQIEAMKAAWAAKLKTQTDEFKKTAMQMMREAQKKPSEVKLTMAGPVTPTVPPYPWWDILVAGVFQPTAPTPGGPFLPGKIFVPGDVAVCLVAVWLNPAPINWIPAGPSAAEVMNNLNLRINFPTISLINVAPGPAPASIIMNPLGSFGPLPWLKIVAIQIGNGLFPSPPQGQPTLYEMNVTADVTGPTAMRFAGFCTWVFDPDLEPAIFPPPLRPEAPPHWQFEIPMRFMTYTP
jgi:hypothetical protein